MKVGASLPHSRQPATCPCSEPNQSSPHNSPFHVLKIHVNIILSSKSGSSKWSLSLRFPHQTPLCASHFLIRATFPTHPILFNLITRIICGVEYRSLSSSFCSLLHYPVTSFLLGPVYSSAHYFQTPLAYIPPSM